jgi:release factor glutamine methyltransferase
VTRGELQAELAALLDARHEARFILDEVLGPSPASPGRPLVEGEITAARAMAVRRKAREPLQYIFGHWPFRRLDLQLDPRVLIPRPETEQVVDVALAEIALLGAAPPMMVDAGTGSGAIALSLAIELAHGEVWALDSSTDALAVARVNLESVLHQHGDSMLPVTLLESNWLAALPGALRGAVTVVVANPPYVSYLEWEELAEDVRREPRTALVAHAGSDGTPGLAAVEELLRQARHWLSHPGAVVIELAPDQAGRATRMARSLGYVDVRVDPDLAGRPRALVGRLR